MYFVTPRLYVCRRFRPHPLSGRRHFCALVFSPTHADWLEAVYQTEEWYQHGWCSYDERQLVLNDIWRLMDEAAPTVGVRTK